jgi:hypothetical protein
MDTPRLGRNAPAAPEALPFPTNRSATSSRPSWHTSGSRLRRWATRLALLTIVATFALLLTRSVDDALNDRYPRRDSANVALAHHIVADQILLYGDLDLADELVAPDALVQTPDGVWHGPNGLRTFASMLHASVADLRFRIETIEAEGDVVQMHWVMSGTVREPVLGIEPTNAPALVTGTLAVHIDGGLVQNVVLATAGQPLAIADIDA